MRSSQRPIPPCEPSTPEEILPPAGTEAAISLHPRLTILYESNKVPAHEGSRRIINAEAYADLIVCISGRSFNPKHTSKLLSKSGNLKVNIPYIQLRT